MRNPNLNWIPWKWDFVTVDFSDELLPEEYCLGKLVGVILLSGPGLLEILTLHPPLLFSCGEESWRKGYNFPLLISLNNSSDF